MVQGVLTQVDRALKSIQLLARITIKPSSTFWIPVKRTPLAVSRKFPLSSLSMVPPSLDVCIVTFKVDIWPTAKPTCLHLSLLRELQTKLLEVHQCQVSDRTVGESETCSSCFEWRQSVCCWCAGILLQLSAQKPHSSWADKTDVIDNQKVAFEQLSRNGMLSALSFHLGTHTHERSRT